MNRMRLAVMVAALLGVQQLARAQDTAVPEAGDGAVAGAAAAQLPKVDPVRLAAARRIVDAVFPVGTYARIMQKSMGALTGSMADSVGAMPLSSLAGIGGSKTQDLSKLGKGTLADMMAILDPAYRQRLTIATTIMTGEMATMMSEMEPTMREALAHAYARRFYMGQLGELNRFFATPTGHAYASESLTMMTDPDVVAAMRGLLPMVMKRMPDIAAKMEAATASLPKPRTYAQLTPAEKARMDALVGADAAKSDNPSAP